MAANAAILTRKSLLGFRFPGLLSRNPPAATFTAQLTRIPVNHLHTPLFTARSSYYPAFLASTSYRGLKRLELFESGPNLFRASAVSDGSSNSGGGYGGSGDGNSGGGGGGDGGSGGEGGGKWSLLTWYLSLLEKYPVWTKAITSAILTCVGDLICQLWIDAAPSLDGKRTFLFTFLGLVLVGPTLHFWYLYLSRLVTTPGASGAFFRLLLDQFIFAPIFIGVFLSTLVTLEGRASQVIPKLQQEWVSSVLANWQLWIPFQFLNFRFVPQQFQVLAANLVSLVWNVILSYKAHKEIVVK
ncbi:protein Mpv17-like [Ipomoea triloba]|uniref:protein Mpv17-like n=1 Tax=Ipomoea triloba TaxID=35885 RepID=UPI00125CD634|nr:protein Mpv17-like [Ipomoea triloba]